ARLPAVTASTAAPWTSTPRILAGSPRGKIVTASPTATRPPAVVPVTTVPNPRTAKTRSTGRRKPASTGRGARAAGGGGRGAQRVEARAGPRRDRHEWGVGEEGAGQGAPDLLADQGQPVGVDQVRLGQRDDAAPDPEELTDRQVLAGLGHDALVRGDDEAHEV